MRRCWRSATWSASAMRTRERHRSFPAWITWPIVRRYYLIGFHHVHPAAAVLDRAVDDLEARGQNRWHLALVG
jgi:hypothetical protein